MKISIIGGCGFIGLSLYKFLSKKKHIIKIIDTKKRFLKTNLHNNNFRLVNYDNFKSIKKALQGTEILINLYSRFSPSSSSSANKIKLKKEVQINRDIFKVSKKLKIKKIIFASSGGTIYGKKNKFPIKESFINKPISNYGKIKLDSEKCLKSIFNNNYYILRISNVYGSLQYKYSKVGIIAKIIDTIKKNKNFEIWGSSKIVRDYLYIDDLLRIIEILILSEVKKGTYNISSARGYDIDQLIKKISKIMQKKCEIRLLNKRLFDVSKNVLCNKKIYHQTLWRPQIKIEDGIKKMLDAYTTSLY